MNKNHDFVSNYLGAELPPDPDFEYYVDYMVFDSGLPKPFEDYSDEFNIVGYMGKWQIQEQSTDM